MLALNLAKSKRQPIYFLELLKKKMNILGVFMRRFCKVVPGIAKFGKCGICYYSYSSLTCHLGVDIISCQHSTICPSGSGALRSQTWLRKIDARYCVDIMSCQPLDATSCVDFAKQCLASQSS